VPLLAHSVSQTSEYDLRPSANFEKAGVDDWLEISRPTMKVVNDIFDLVHPALYESGKKALDRLGDDDLTKEASEKWESVFTGISVISNRRTKPHTDHFGSHCWFDLIISLGSCLNAWLEFPELGLRLRYRPGTVIAFTGNLLTHTVNDWGEGDCLCYAFFMRSEVLKKFKLEDVGWMTIDEYCEEREWDQENS
jgi:hypothetical protein